MFSGNFRGRKLFFSEIFAVSGLFSPEKSTKIAGK
jgi:hypothetical protein